MRRLLSALVLVALPACATMKKDQTVCPEYRSLRCLTEPACNMDQARGCRVCQCAPPSPDNNSKDQKPWQSPVDNATPPGQ
jgi:hypothetical protein